MVELSELQSEVMDGKVTLSCGGDPLTGWLITGNGLRSQLCGVSDGGKRLFQEETDGESKKREKNVNN